MEKLAKLINSGYTVWSLDEIRQLLETKTNSTLYNLLQRYQKKGLLKNFGHGLRGFNKYEKMELASKIRFPSYISLETVLQREGIIFQDYTNSTYLVSDNSISINIDGSDYFFSKIKNSILTNNIGIINNGRYMIASKERAICDRLYLTPNYRFDNLSNLDLELMEKLKNIYNKRTSLNIEQIINDHRNK